MVQVEVKVEPVPIACSHCGQSPAPAEPCLKDPYGFGDHAWVRLPLSGYRLEILGWW